MKTVWETCKAISLLMLAAGPVSAASFDCAKATRPQEKLICASPEVSRLDSSMASSYKALLQRLSPEAQNDVRRSQREWLAFWPTSCRRGDDPLDPKSKDAQDCAQARYKDRISLLEAPNSVAGDIVLYPVSTYAIRRSAAQVEWIKYAQSVTHFPAVDLGQVAQDKKNLAMRIDRWLRTDMASSGQAVDAVSDGESGRRFIASLSMLLSTETAGYFYGHGAAHPVSGYSTQHFYLPKARPMLAADIFQGKQWKDGLTVLVEKELKEQLADFYYVKSRGELKDLVVDPASWQLSRKELTLRFSPYEVAPYAAGAPRVSLSWSTLMPWLTAQVSNDISR